MKEKMEEGKVNINENQEDVNNANEVQAEESKGRRNKRNKNEKQLEELKEKNEELNDKYLRLFSEFDNYRKRTAKEKIELSKTAAESIMVDLLPILDDFERAGTSSREAKDIESVINGVQMIEKQMLSLLEKKWGLKKFAPLNEPFDPEKHEALMMAESPDVSEATVAEVYQNGYILNDRIIRHAKVKVSMPAKKENE